MPAAFRLGYPRLVIAVAAEDDAPVRRERVADKLMQGLVEVLRLFKLIRKTAELIRHYCVEDRDRPGNGLARPGHAEFKLVAREREGRRPVAVRRILRDSRKHIHADAQRAVLKLGIAALIHYRVHYPFKLRAEEDGHYRGRRFLRAEAVVVPGKGDGTAKKLLIFICPLDERGKEQQKRCILAGRLARREEIDAGIRGQRPVDMLAGAVHTGKGLFMQQADHAVPLGDLLHRLHDELVLVAGGVRVGEYGGHFMLRRGDFVMLRL